MTASPSLCASPPQEAEVVKVVLVDDQEMIRVGLRAILDSEPRIKIAAEADDGFALLDLLRTKRADVVLLDIRLPGIDGIETLRRLRAEPATRHLKVIMLTTFENETTILDALRAGANGFLGKTVGPRELITAILDTGAGVAALSPSARSTLVSFVGTAPNRQADSSARSLLDRLTARERDVVAAIARGGDNESIGKELAVSPYTVKTHANRAMMKVNARDRASLVILAYRAGLVD